MHRSLIKIFYLLKIKLFGKIIFSDKKKLNELISFGESINGGPRTHLGNCISVGQRQGIKPRCFMCDTIPHLIRDKSGKMYRTDGEERYDL
jgi:hypothetical protein